MAQTLDQLVIELKADIRGLQAALLNADGSFKRLGRTGQQEADRIDRAFARAGTALAGYFSAQAMFNFARASVETAMRVESLNAKMVAATGSADAAASSMAFLRSESERLGVNFLASADGFASFSASALRAGLTLTDVKSIFQGVTEAATALQLPTYRVELLFQALSQMASKQVISMEELKQQMGESLPGAIQIFAEAMGKTPQEFIKMVENGQVLASDLKKLGKAFHEEFGNAAVEASKNARAETNRLMNAINDLQVKMAGGEAMESYTAAVRILTDAISDPAVQDGLETIAGGVADITAAAIVGIATLIKWSATLMSELQKTEQQVRASGFSDRPSMQGVLGRINRAGLPSGPMQTGGSDLASAGGLLGALGGGGSSSSTGGGGGGSGKDSERDMLGKRVEMLKYQLASESEQLAIEYEKQQELLEEALEKKAITEQTYRDLKLEAELDYKNKFGELWVQEAEDRVRIEEEAQNAILGNRRAMYGALQGLMSQFGGKSKAFAIAAIAVEKAQAIQSVLIESKKAAMAARAWAMAMGGPVAAEAAYAREIMMGQVTAGMIAAAGLAQAFGGGGGDSSDSGGGGGGSGLASNTPGAPGSGVTSSQAKNVFITIEGEYFGPEQARKLVNGLNEFIGDGTIKLNVSEARYV